MGAIKPSFILNNLPSLEKDKLEKKGISDEEKHLFALSHTAGWQDLKEIIDNAVKDLDNLNELAMAQGMSFEEIGRNSVVITQTKGIIKKIFDRINDAVEVCEKPDDKE